MSGGHTEGKQPERRLVVRHRPRPHKARPCVRVAMCVGSCAQTCAWYKGGGGRRGQALGGPNSSPGRNEYCMKAVAFHGEDAQMPYLTRGRGPGHMPGSWETALGRMHSTTSASELPLRCITCRELALAFSVVACVVQLPPQKAHSFHPAVGTAMCRAWCMMWRHSGHSGTAGSESTFGTRKEAAPKWLRFLADELD